MDDVYDLGLDSIRGEVARAIYEFVVYVRRNDCVRRFSYLTASLEYPVASQLSWALLVRPLGYGLDICGETKRGAE